MKKFNVLFISIFFCLGHKAIFSVVRPIENIVCDKYGFGQSLAKKSEPANVDFSFKDTDLVDVIYAIAGPRHDNIILPSPTGQDAIKFKVNFDAGKKLTSDEAWDLLNDILDVANYAVVLSGDMLKIVKKDKDLVNNQFRIFKEDTKIFVNTQCEEIPDTDERIIFICYFSNIGVPNDKNGQQQGENVVKQVIQMFTGNNVGPESREGTAAFRFIPESNGVMIVDKACNIRSMMNIFKELDKVGFKERLEKITLMHTNAESVAENIFNNEKAIFGKKQKTTYKLGKRVKSKAKYFDKETRVIPDSRSNSLILLGSKESIDRIKEFVYRFIDIPVEGGRSILHRKKLDYLNCKKIAEVLTKLVDSSVSSEGSQAGGGNGSSGGKERFLSSKIIIGTDKPESDSDGSSQDEKGRYKYSGTNSLLVAANNDDWVKINDLIEKLDRPVKQVIIEVLVVDLTMDGTRSLGSQTRNPALAPILNLATGGQGLNAQSAMLSNFITQPCSPGSECVNCGSKTLKSDLMQLTSASGSVTNPIVSNAANGSTIFSISDKNGEAWSVLKLLDLYNNRKVLSHPYIVAKNNYQAMVKVDETRILQGNDEATNSGTIKINKIPVAAGITIKLTPKIHGADQTGRASVNLQIDLDISQFKTEFVASSAGQQAENPMVKRIINTNATLKTGEILALGGLMRVDSSNSESQTPILGKIPLIGWLFKSRAAQKTRTNLTVFIRATVVEPEIMSKMGTYTKDYINLADEFSREGGLFEGVRDPVTRWFFGQEDDARVKMNSYTEIYKKPVSTEELRIVNLQDLPNKYNNQNDNTVLAENIAIENSVVENNLSEKFNPELRQQEVIAEVEGSGQAVVQTGSDNYLKPISGHNSYELFEDNNLPGISPVSIASDAGAKVSVANNGIDFAKDLGAVNLAVLDNNFGQQLNSNIGQAVEKNSIVLANNLPVASTSKNNKKAPASGDKLKDLLQGSANPFVS